MSPPPTAESPLADRFAAAMAQLAPFERSPKLAVAVSGGPDSRALALLAAGWCAEKGALLTALAVDHGLRAESAAEIAATSAWLAANGIPTIPLTVAVAPGNRQAEARRARYDALEDACRAQGILHLLLGHHALDQRETMLMRLARGSGARGLAAMRPVEYRRGVRLLRPLLAIEPEALALHLAALGHDAIDDPSNADPHYQRARLRPLARALRDGEGWNASRVHQQALQLRREADRQARSGAGFLARHAAFHPAGFARLDRTAFLALPEADAVPLLRRLLAMLRGHGMLRREETLRLLADVREERGSACLHGCRIVRHGADLYFCRAPVADEEASLSVGRWDGRFRVLTGQEGVRIAYPLARWSQARQFARDHGMKADWPAAVWQALPALWQGASLSGLPCVVKADPILVLAPAEPAS